MSKVDWGTFNGKEPGIATGTTAQYWRGDKSWQTLISDAVPEGSSNLYFTNTRSRAALSAVAPITYNSASGQLSLSQSNSTTDGYLSKVDWDMFNRKLAANTAITAGTNTKITYDANGLITGGAQATATDISNAASGNITATTVQGALNELDTKKLAGIGTVNYLPKFTNGSNLGNSQIFDNGTNVGIGTITPTAKLQVAGNISSTGNITASGNISANIITAATSFTSSSIIATTSITSPSIIATGNINAGGDLVVGGAITATGDISTNGAFIASDIRLKRKVVPVSGAIQTIEQLVPVSYEKKSSIDSDDYKSKEIGFIAQEVRKILPVLVYERNDQYKTLSLNYTALIPLLTKAIQEQQELILKQDNKIEELTGRIEKLEKLFEQKNNK